MISPENAIGYQDLSEVFKTADQLTVTVTVMFASWLRFLFI